LVGGDLGDVRLREGSGKWDMDMNMVTVKSESNTQIKDIRMKGYEKSRNC
jgi:hypothetical protein